MSNAENDRIAEQISTLEGQLIGDAMDIFDVIHSSKYVTEGDLKDIQAWIDLYNHTVMLKNRF